MFRSKLFSALLVSASLLVATHANADLALNDRDWASEARAAAQAGFWEQANQVEELLRDGKPGEARELLAEGRFAVSREAPGEETTHYAVLGWAACREGDLTHTVDAAVSRTKRIAERAGVTAGTAAEIVLVGVIDDGYGKSNPTISKLKQPRTDLVLVNVA